MVELLHTTASRQLYFDLGQYQKAIEDHTRVIELNPDDASAYSNRARCYEKLGDKGSGCIYVLMREQDLPDRAFDKCWVVMQCT